MKTTKSKLSNRRNNLLAALLMMASGAVMAQFMSDLGTLGGSRSTAYGVSADGSLIVGESALTGNSVFRAFKYTGNTMTDLGTLGGTYSYAYGVSADGSVIVGKSSIAGDSATHAFKYTGTTMMDLGTLGGSTSSANAISADGSVIVGNSNITGNSASHAFKYTGTTMTDLGTLGGASSSAKGVSADGSVIVGQSDVSAFTYRAFKYTGTTMTDLGTLGGTYSSANAVSADGTVIVGNSNITGNSATHAFKYTGTTMTDLGTLGGTYSSAKGVSADGSVIVGQSINAGGNNHAFKYTGTTMTDLGTLGGSVSSANAVSADGKVIVGNAYTPGGVDHAFVYQSVMVDVDNTYSALTANSYQLNALLNAQYTALLVNLNSDCTVYGTNNVCVGIGGRYTNVNSPTFTQRAGDIQLGYRFDPTFRAGVFLDQVISTTTPSNYSVKNSQPLVGLFAVYSPTGTNLGLQVKATAAYSNNGVNITRTTLPNTEAGQGSSTVSAQGAQLEGAYGFSVGDSWITSPFAGITATSVARNGYTETAGATFPITYNQVTQSGTTVYAGAKVMGFVTPKISVGASAGVQQALSSNISNYSGSIYYLGSFSLAAPSISQTLPFISANADYWVEKNQRARLSAYYYQQPLNTGNGTTIMLSYTVGL